MALVDNVRKTVDGMGQVELSGIKLESADPRLLDVGSMNLDQHVAMQPSAIAFYGAMKKEAARGLAMLERSFERWKSKQWATAKAAVMSGSTQTYKPTVADIESRFIVDNEVALEDWDKKIDKARVELDTLDAWYEGWRQKSFAIREHVSITDDERFNETSIGGGGNNGGGPREGKPLSSDRIKEIMRRRTEKGQG
jgi:hypothetical protein